MPSENFPTVSNIDSESVAIRVAEKIRGSEKKESKSYRFCNIPDVRKFPNSQNREGTKQQR